MEEQELTQMTSTRSDDVMDMTLGEHYKERIAYHMKMLNYYLIEEMNEKLVP